MLTLLYPQQDYTAAEIALKIQSLVASEGKKIYTVPKHFGRNQMTVEKNLQKANPVIFLAYDSRALDNQTIQELDFLRQAKKETIAVIPDSFVARKGVFTQTFSYEAGNKAKFMEAINNYIASVDQKKKQEDESFGLLALIGVLLLALIFLVSDKKDEDE